MCGIFGFAGNAPADINKIKLLGAYNQERGPDSCGFATLKGVEHGIDEEKEWMKFIVKNEITLHEKDNSIICHTRKSTMGSKNKDNAHPFKLTIDILNKHNKIVKDYSVYGVHNGQIKNWLSLCRERNIDTAPIDVDSKGFFNALSIDLYKKNYTIFEKYEGMGAFLWISELEPNTIFAFRGESKITNTSELPIEEERPLYYYLSENGVYFSSTWQSLFGIGGNDTNVFKLGANTVYCIKDNKVVEVAKTERAEKGYQTYYAPRSTYKHDAVEEYKYTRSATVADALNYREIDGGEKETVSINRGNTIYISEALSKYTYLLENVIDIKKDIMPKKIKIKGKIYFEEGRFQRNGHMYNKPTDRVLLAKDGSLCIDKSKIKNGSSTASCFLHEGEMKMFEVGKFTAGMFMNMWGDIKTTIPLYQNTSIIYPMCDTEYYTPDKAIFYTSGVRANGLFIYPGSSKEYGFYHGVLKYIIDHVNTSITHTKDVLLSYPAGKKSKASKENDEVHFLDIISSSYIGNTSRTIIDPTRYDIWEPFLIENDTNVYFLKTGNFWFSSNNNIVDVYQDTNLFNKTTPFTGVLTREIYQSLKAEDYMTASEFKLYSKKTCQSTQYESDLTELQTFGDRIAKTINFKKVNIADISLTSVGVISTVKSLLASSRKISSSAIMSVPFLTFLKNYNPLGDTLYKNHSTFAIQLTAFIDYNNWAIYEPILPKSGTNKGKLRFELIGFLYGNGINRPATDTLDEIRLQVATTQNAEVYSDLYFRDFCKKRVSLESFNTNKQNFKDYFADHNLNITSLWNLEDYLTDPNISANIYNAMGLSTVKYSTENVNIGEEVHAIEKSAVFEDAHTIEQEMADLINFTQLSVEEILNKATPLLDFIGEEGTENYSTLVEVEKALEGEEEEEEEEEMESSDAHYLELMDYEEELENAKNDFEAIYNYFGYIVSCVKKETGNSSHFIVTPNPIFPIIPNKKIQSHIKIAISYNPDFLDTMEIYPDGTIREELPKTKNTKSILFRTIGNWHIKMAFVETLGITLSPIFTFFKSEDDYGMRITKEALVSNITSCREQVTKNKNYEKIISKRT